MKLKMTLEQARLVRDALTEWMEWVSYADDKTFAETRNQRNDAHEMICVLNRKLNKEGVE